MKEMMDDLTEVYLRNVGRNFLFMANWKEQKSFLQYQKGNLNLLVLHNVDCSYDCISSVVEAQDGGGSIYPDSRGIILGWVKHGCSGGKLAWSSWTFKMHTTSFWGSPCTCWGWPDLSRSAGTSIRSQVNPKDLLSRGWCVGSSLSPPHPLSRRLSTYEGPKHGRSRY